MRSPQELVTVILESLESSSSFYVDERSRPEPPDGRPVRSMDRWSLVIVRPVTEGKSAFARWDESFERATAVEAAGIEPNLAEVLTG